MKELLTILFASMGGFIALLAIYYYVIIKINKKNLPLSIQQEQHVSIQEEDIIVSIND
jgi:hypothetical protein